MQDVIKVRLQAQGAKPVASNLHESVCRQGLECRTHIKLSTGISEVWCKTCDVPRIAQVPYFKSSWEAGIKILKYEGVTSLWRGLSPALIMAVPSTAFYFSLYDIINEKGKALAESLGYPLSLSPLVSGTFARASTTIGVSPLELVRTQQQAMSTPPSIYVLARKEVRLRGFLSLWRGLSPTLWRDVPFSAMYWTSMELVRDKLLSSPRFVNDSIIAQNPRVASSFVAGAIGGVFAAFITHPFDVAKTRQQIASLELLAAPSSEAAVPSAATRPTLKLIRDIAQQEGQIP